VTAIQEQAERMRQVIRGMLGLVRGQNPVAEPLAPDELARAAAALVAHRFAQREVALSLEVPEDLARVMGDRRLLEHALINLLLNARDACAAGGRVVMQLSSTDSQLVFRVIDDGPGISQAEAERAMEPFFTTKPLDEGSGLGLAIANEIVKSHHGSLHIAPRPGRGTCATITLQRLPKEDHGQPSPPPHPGG
jgi:signal transduction histidine kinase